MTFGGESLSSSLGRKRRVAAKGWGGRCIGQVFGQPLAECEIFFGRTRLEVRSGRRAKFWIDVWWGEVALKDHYPVCFSFAQRCLSWRLMDERYLSWLNIWCESSKKVVGHWLPRFKRRFQNSKIGSWHQWRPFCCKTWGQVGLKAVPLFFFLPQGTQFHSPLENIWTSNAPKMCLFVWEVTWVKFLLWISLWRGDNL